MAGSDILPQTTHLGAVQLRVGDVEQALPVWRDLIGLQVLSRTAQSATLGLADRNMIILHGGADPAAPDKVIGLFHVAIHVPTRADLACVLARLRAAGHRHSGQDHLLSIALYFADPDGNGIEIALDTPDRGTLDRNPEGPHGIANDGTRHSMLEPLDLDALLADHPGARPDQPLPGTSIIGHIHFRTNQRDAAHRFYSEVIGLLPGINSAAFKFCDTGTALRRHMVAFNTWGGENLPQAASNAPGVTRFTLILPDAAALDAVRARLDRAGVDVHSAAGGLTCQDPDGNRILLAIAV
jgi:catechol 2,3-dioxygenase